MASGTGAPAVTVVHREPPYEKSPTPAERSKMEIEKLLLNYGAEGVRMTTMKDGRVMVEFVLETETGGTARRFACRVETPLIERERSRLVKEPGAYYAGRKTIIERDTRAELRLLYWYLKALVEASAYGLLSAERTFYSHIVFSLPDGTQATAGEVAEKMISEGKAPVIPGFGESARPALPGPRPEPQEAEFTVSP